jgi:cell division protein FtsQ
VASTGSSERSRKRFARRQWARRWLAWRYVVAVVVVVALVVGSAWLVLFSSVLAVDGVEVSGADTLSAEDVRAAADVPDGEPLARIDLDAIRARVQALAVVKSADVTRQWPDRVRIEIEERVAVAVVDIGGRLRGMDASGVLFRDYRTAPADLPRVRTASDTRADALEEAATVASALPDDLAGKVAYLTVETVDLIELVLKDGRTVLWGSAEESAAKGRVLEVLLERKAQWYDVSVPGRPVIRK